MCLSVQQLYMQDFPTVDMYVTRGKAVMKGRLFDFTSELRLLETGKYQGRNDMGTFRVKTG